MPPLPDPGLFRSTEGQALVRQLFRALTQGHSLSHEARQKIVRSLGLLTREDIQNLSQRLDQAEGTARRLGLLTNDE